MKKMLFLILFLISLGTVGLSAQVRIGGNAAPNGAAVLDLNLADSANYGKLGLSLPRVSLPSATTQLTASETLNGTLVYNTNESMGTGLYYWVTDQWVKLGAGGGGADAALSVTGELNTNYTATADDDIILFTTTESRRLTLPTTGITVGKKLYVSDIGNFGVSLYPQEALRDPSQNMAWPGFPVTLLFVGTKWQIMDVVY